MKRWIVLVLVLLTAAVFALATLRWDTLVLDGVSGEILAQMAPDEGTEYAAGYSAQRFRSVEIGMTMNEVDSLLGTPLSVDGPYGDERETTLYYSRNRKDGSYRVRQIILRGGQVVSVDTGYWYD